MKKPTTKTAAVPDAVKLAAAARVAGEEADKQARFAEAARKRFKAARKAHKVAKKAAKVAKKHARKARKLWETAMEQKRRPAKKRLTTSVAKKVGTPAVRKLAAVPPATAPVPPPAAPTQSDT